MDFNRRWFGYQIDQISGLYTGPDTGCPAKIYTQRGWILSPSLALLQERGARYTLIKLTREQKKIGVIAASAGNYIKNSHLFKKDLLISYYQ